MTVLTHGFDAPVDSAENRDRVEGAAKAYLSAFKRFCLYALTALSAGGLVAAAIALKTAIYFWRHGL